MNPAFDQARITREAQGLSLPLGRSAGAAAFNLQGTLQTDSQLTDLELIATKFGLVTDITVAGFSLMGSNQGFLLSAFNPLALVEGQGRELALPLAAQQIVAVSGTMVGAGTIVGGVKSDPVIPEEVIPVNQLPPELQTIGYGLGLVNIGAGADGTLTATVRRPGKLGRLCLDHDGTIGDIVVRNVRINNVPLLAGLPNTDCIIEGFSPFASDGDGNVLAIDVDVNDQITLDFHNYSAGALNVGGGIFALFEPADVIIDGGLE